MSPLSSASAIAPLVSTLERLARGRMPSRAQLRALLVSAISAAVLVMAGPAPVSGQQGDAPGRPTNLTGAVAHDAVTLTWDAPEDSTVTGYQILRLNRAEHALGDFQVHVDDTGSADTTYTDTDVEPEARYVYRVKARNGDTLGPQSSYFDADLPAPPVPAWPTGLVGTVTHDAVTLTWDDPQDDLITGYQILRRNPAEHAVGDFNIHVEDTGSPASTYTDTDVEAGARYVYRIKARNSAGLSPQSGYFNADVPQPPELVVSFQEATYAVDEGESVVVAVILDRDPEREVVIDIIPVGQGGASDADYTVAADSVTFNAGETRKEFTVTAADDTEDDDGESVLLQFEADLPVRVTSGSVDETTISITDDDEANEGGIRSPDAPTGLTGTATRWGVSLSWDDPEDAGITGYQILRRDRLIQGADEFDVLVNDTKGPGTSYRDCGVRPHRRYVYRVKAHSEGGISPASGSFEATVPAKTTTTVVPGAVPVEVDAVPIVVESTPADYFVLYFKQDVNGTEMELPVLVKLGESGTTTLSENVAASPKERYRVEKHSVSNPSDIDGDCTDDITELNSPTMSPFSGGNSITTTDGVVGALEISAHAAFEQLSVRRDADKGKYLKFTILDLDTDRPRLYFQHTRLHPFHNSFLHEYFAGSEISGGGVFRGNLMYRPSITAPDGSSGVYVMDTAERFYPLSKVERAYAVLAARMPIVNDNLNYWIPNRWISSYRVDLGRYESSRINLLFDEDIFGEVDYIAMNEATGYGLLTEWDADERPNPREVVILEAVPNELSRVAGIISAVPQAQLSHVNLRAVQNGIPNAFIRDALDNPEIADLIGSYVRFVVSHDGYTIRAASKAEVDAHYAAFRPAESQTPERDLSVTEITRLSEIEFDDWRAFGVKAANVAVLGSFDFADGTVPDGYAIPFYFYDRFMRETTLGEEKVLGKKSAPAEDKITLEADTTLIEAVEAMLAHSRFQEDFEIQEEMLDDLRDAIEDAEAPDWIVEAIKEMNEGFDEGINRRYRSSANSEDLPGFNGAGLYDSKSQKPSEDEKDLAKSLKEVYASLWTFRAFAEREFHRVDHMAAAMGVLVHPSYQDELVNGVAVSFDPIQGGGENYYVNSQVGEDRVTNPEANSTPEEILLRPEGKYTVLAFSNLVDTGQPLMSDAQMALLRQYLEAIHEGFEKLYEPASDNPFAMEIEFKITSENNLAVKQARPWVYGPSLRWYGPASVSNLDQRSRTRPQSITHLGKSIATDFTTGYASHRWVLNGVRLDIGDWTTRSTPTVALYRAGSDGPGELITTLTNPPKEAGIQYFRAPDGTLLTAGATYTIEVSSDIKWPDNFTVWTTRADDEDDSSAAGWWIGNNSWISSGGDLARSHYHGQSLKMEIDSSGISRKELSLSSTSLSVPENGSATYSVALKSRPAAKVTVTVIPPPDSGITVNSDTLNFTAGDWDVEQTVTVSYSPVGEATDRNVGSILHLVSSDDDDYSGINSSSIAVTTETVVAESNAAATGAPKISGIAGVGETLTAHTSGIADEDGLSGASFNYQWLRNDSDILGATGSTYTLTDEDRGKTVKVRVSFTDDAGYDEELISAATGEVAARTKTGSIWSATMTAAPLYVDHGYSDFDGFQNGSLSTRTFEVDGVTYTVKVIEASGWFYIGFDLEVSAAFTLDVGGTRLASSDASFESYSYGKIYRWQDTGIDWNDGDEVKIAMSQADADSD